jgi:hypothetical protein
MLASDRGQVVPGVEQQRDLDGAVMTAVRLKQIPGCALGVILTARAILFPLTTLALTASEQFRHPIRVGASLVAMLVLGSFTSTDLRATRTTRKESASRLCLLPS